PVLRTLGPTILAKRKIQQSISNRCWNAPIIPSHASLVAPYKEIGRVGLSSGIGCRSLGPYTAEVDANASLRTPRRRMLSRTQYVKIGFCFRSLSVASPGANFTSGFAAK